MKNYLINNFDQSQMAHILDELPFWSAPFGLTLLDSIDYKKNTSALDIGFGTGFPLTEIAMRLGNSSIVYGIDPWVEAIDKIQNKIQYFGINNTKLIEGVAESIPLENNSIDLITSNNGLNNVSDIDKCLAECARIMKQGGQFVQTLNMDRSMFEFYTVFEDILSELGMNKEIEAMHQHITQKRPSIASYSNKIRENGFVIRNIEHHQFNYFFVDGTAMLNHYFIRLAFMNSWVKLLPENKVNDIFDRIESRLNEQAQITNGIRLSIPYALIDAIKL